MKKEQIARIQEEIKESRGNRTMFTWVMTAGIFIAAVPLIVLALTESCMEGSIWILCGGIVFAICGIVGATYYELKVKRLIKSLGKEE